MSYTGVVLAGGKSFRMGEDKALLEWKGKSLLEFSVDALKPLCDEILIIGDPEKYGYLGYRVIPDIFPESGPVSGIYTALTYAVNENCLVLSCDIPNITSEILQELIEETDFGNVRIASCGRIHPLVGMYRKSALDTFKHCLDQGKLKLLDVIELLETSIHEFSADKKKHFINVNTPSDLNKWKEKSK